MKRSAPQPGKLWISLGVILLLLGSFIALTAEMLERDEEFAATDYAVLRWVAQFRSSALNGIMVDLTALGSPTIVTLLSVVFFLVFLLLKDRISALHLVTASIGGGILSRLFKDVIARERPDIVPRLVDVSGFSYPSGHALFAAAIYLTLAILAARHFPRLGQRAAIFALAVAVVAAVGLSRVYLGVHYPSDVASGILLGAAWAFILGAAMAKVSQRRSVSAAARSGRK